MTSKQAFKLTFGLLESLNWRSSGLKMNVNKMEYFENSHLRGMGRKLLYRIDILLEEGSKEKVTMSKIYSIFLLKWWKVKIKSRIYLFTTSLHLCCVHTMLRKMKPMIIMSNFLLVTMPKITAWGPHWGRGNAFRGFFVPAFFIAAMYFFWSSVMNVSSDPPYLRVATKILRRSNVEGSVMDLL